MGRGGRADPPVRGHAAIGDELSEVMGCRGHRRCGSGVVGPGRGLLLHPLDHAEGVAPKPARLAVVPAEATGPVGRLGEPCRDLGRQGRGHSRPDQRRLDRLGWRPRALPPAVFRPFTVRPVERARRGRPAWRSYAAQDGSDRETRTEALEPPEAAHTEHEQDETKPCPGHRARDVLQLGDRRRGLVGDRPIRPADRVHDPRRDSLAEGAGRSPRRPFRR
jgi:hypothetical protein